LINRTLITQSPNIKYVILNCVLIIIYIFYNISISVPLGGKISDPVIQFSILKSRAARPGKISHYYPYDCPVYALFNWAAVSPIIWFIIIITEISFSFFLSEFVLLIFFDFYSWILLSIRGIPSNSIIIIYASKGQLSLTGEIVMKSPLDWWKYDDLLLLIFLKNTVTLNFSLLVNIFLRRVIVKIKHFRLIIGFAICILKIFWIDARNLIRK
jgi:hypothetical protein